MIDKTVTVLRTIQQYVKFLCCHVEPLTLQYTSFVTHVSLSLTLTAEPHGGNPHTKQMKTEKLPSIRSKFRKRLRKYPQTL